MKLRFEPEYLAGMSFAMASLFIASVSVGAPTRKFFLVFGASYLSLQAVFMLLMAWARKSSKAFRETLSEEQAAIRSLTINEAKRRVLASLSDPQKFVVVAGIHKQTEDLSGLAPELKEFFDRYDTVEMCQGDLKLSRSAIGPSSLRKNFIRIGTDTGDAEVVALPGRDSVFVIDATEMPGASPEEYPSIYHLVLLSCRLIHPEESEQR